MGNRIIALFFAVLVMWRASVGQRERERERERVREVRVRVCEHWRGVKTKLYSV